MLGLVIVVGSVSLADSINPSTVIPGLWLASAPAARGLVSFTLGVFTVYLVGGVVLVFGPGPVLMAALHHVQGPVEHAVQTAAGVLALGFAVVVWRARRDERVEPAARRCSGRASACALGAGIAAIELPTAFIYFGAISAILAGHVSAAGKISLLVAYNAVFVAPLIALLIVRRFAGERAEVWLASTARRLQRTGRVVLSGLAGVAGAALLGIGLTGLLIV